MKQKATLILMRHGESMWNLKNQFTGWVDVPLTEKGVKEAIEGGKAIAHLPIDVVHTSTLIRAHMTLMLAMLHHHSGKIPIIQHSEDSKLRDWGKMYSEKAEAETIPVHCAWELNERMYGELQGLNKAETADKFGAEQVHIWRRSYDTPPPEGESLEMTAQRTLPYFNEKILPELQQGRSVFVPAHGNSLRSIVMELDQLSSEEVLKLEIPTGAPIVYTYDGEKFNKETLCRT